MFADGGSGAWGVSIYILYIWDPPMSRMSQAIPPTGGKRSGGYRGVHIVEGAVEGTQIRNRPLMSIRSGEKPLPRLSSIHIKRNRSTLLT